VRWGGWGLPDGRVAAQAGTSALAAAAPSSTAAQRGSAGLR